MNAALNPCRCWMLTALLAGAMAFGVLALPARADRPAASPEAGRGPRVTLVDPGETPREPLRRWFVEGQSGAFKLDLVSELHQKMNGMEFPLQRYPQSGIELHTRVLAVGEDGTASVRFRIAGAGVDEGASDGVDPGLIEAAKQDLLAIKGAEITYSVSSTGVLSNPGVIVKGEGPLNASAQRQLEQFQRSLEQIVIPLPEEPVGVNARWRVSTPIDLAGIKATRSIEYQLVERHEGGRLELAFKVTVSASPQPIRNDTIPAGAELQLTELAGTGDGVGVLELGAAVATRVTWRVALNRDHLYRVPVAGQRTPREDRISFLSVSATTVTRLPPPGEASTPSP